MKEIIFSGIGGQGVLVAGNIIADIAMEDDLNVSWYPSYGFEMRGGAANCELKMGEEDLQSPYCMEPDVLFTMSECAIDRFEDRLKPGGVLLINSSVVSEDRTYRDDIKVIKVPATEIANECKNARGTNIVMLGAMAAASELFDLEHTRAGVQNYFAKKGKNNPKNDECFDKGAKAAIAQL